MILKILKNINISFWLDFDLLFFILTQPLSVSLLIGDSLERVRWFTAELLPVTLLRRLRFCYATVGNRHCSLLRPLMPPRWLAVLVGSFLTEIHYCVHLESVFLPKIPKQTDRKSENTGVSQLFVCVINASWGLVREATTPTWKSGSIPLYTVCVTLNLCSM